MLVPKDHPHPNLPPPGALEAEAAGEHLWLLPARAAYWPRVKTLLVADAHFGKAAAFRRAGIPVPAGTTEQNLQRLAELVRLLAPERIVFLGDMLHSRDARDAAAGAFLRWRARHESLDLVLVRGNHERHAGDPPPDWRVECVSEPHVLGAIALAHMPRAVPGAYALGGHTHPGVKLVGPGREYVRLPCFHFTREYAVLPAFGSFTGMADVEPQEGDRVYVIAGTHVIDVPTR